MEQLLPHWRSYLIDRASEDGDIHAFQARMKTVVDQSIA